MYISKVLLLTLLARRFFGVTYFKKFDLAIFLKYFSLQVVIEYCIIVI